MCRECGRHPCDARCPNAPEQKPVMVCNECGEGIYDGDKYFETENGAICKECMDEKETSEILELLGESFSVA